MSEDHAAWMREYESLWLRWDARAGSWDKQGRVIHPALDVREVTDLRAMMLARCVVLAAWYAGRNEPYRLAMWERRLRLHTTGRDGGVYDGTDALAWKSKMQGREASLRNEMVGLRRKGLMGETSSVAKQEVRSA